ncbi:MAG: hypothetical protein ACP5MH_07305 [Thermoproteus sp.]
MTCAPIPSGEALVKEMDTYAQVLEALVGAEKVKGYIVRMKDAGAGVYSLVYWLKTKWEGCEYYIKLYRKWGKDGVLRPVVGLSHVVNCDGELLWYPAIDGDGGVDKECVYKSVFHWHYEGKKGKSWHVVLPPKRTKEEAVAEMKACGDDELHVHFAEVPRYIEYFDFAVLRVSSYRAWSETVYSAHVGDDPMARLHMYLRRQLWHAPGPLSIWH